MRHLPLILPLWMWACLASAQPASPAGGTEGWVGTWTYELAGAGLRCINEPRIQSIQITVKIDAGEEGGFTLTQHRLRSTLVPSPDQPKVSTHIPIDEAWCTLPLRPAGAEAEARRSIEPNSFCGPNEGLGARFAERTVWFAQGQAHIRDRGTLYLWTNVCEYEFEGPMETPAARAEREAREERARPPPPPPPERRKITLVVASALVPVLDEITLQFHRKVLDTQISLTSGSRDSLLTRRKRGEPTHGLMQESAWVGAVCDLTTNFAADELVAVVPKDEAKRFKDLPSLSKAGRVLVAKSYMPLGRHTTAVLERAQKRLGKKVSQLPGHLVQEGDDERWMLGDVLDKKADAAFVYRRAALEAGDRVAIIPLPREFQPFLMYSGGRLLSAKDSTRVRPFMEINTFPWAQQIIQKHGMQWDLKKLEGAVWSDAEAAQKWDAQEAREVEEERIPPAPSTEQ